MVSFRIELSRGLAVWSGLGMASWGLLLLFRQVDSEIAPRQTILATLSSKESPFSMQHPQAFNPHITSSFACDDEVMKPCSIELTHTADGCEERRHDYLQ